MLSDAEYNRKFASLTFHYFHLRFPALCFDDVIFCLNHGLGGFKDCTDFNYKVFSLFNTLISLV
jgi:hypothetical protein